MRAHSLSSDSPRLALALILEEPASSSAPRPMVNSSGNSTDVGGSLAGT